jgi:hypothetical protein
LRAGETVEQTILRYLSDERFAMWSVSELDARIGDEEATKAALARLRGRRLVSQNEFGLVRLSRDA